LIRKENLEGVKDNRKQIYIKKKSYPILFLYRDLDKEKKNINSKKKKKFFFIIQLKKPKTKNKKNF